jgi:hypothetical protein
VTSRFGFAAVMLLAALFAVGCGSYDALIRGGRSGRAGTEASASPAAGTDPSMATATSQPRVVTDLAQLSSTNPLAQLDQQRQLFSRSGQAPPPGSQQPNPTVANIGRFYIANQKTARLVDAPPRPAGDARLLNAKAEQYPEFAYDLVNRTLVLAQDMAPKKLEQHRLPDDIKPVVLTAVMTPEGKLTDIFIERRSGFSAADGLFIDACKQGLWARNPPHGALSNDGNYRLRIEGVIYNYSYDHKGFYSYITHVGLGIL